MQLQAVLLSGIFSSIFRSVDKTIMCDNSNVSHIMFTYSCFFSDQVQGDFKFCF